MVNNRNRKKYVKGSNMTGGGYFSEQLESAIRKGKDKLISMSEGDFWVDSLKSHIEDLNLEADTKDVMNAKLKEKVREIIRNQISLLCLSIFAPSKYMRNMGDKLLAIRKELLEDLEKTRSQIKLQQMEQRIILNIKKNKLESEKETGEMLKKLYPDNTELTTYLNGLGLDRKITEVETCLEDDSGKCETEKNIRFRDVAKKVINIQRLTGPISDGGPEDGGANTDQLTELFGTNDDLLKAGIDEGDEYFAISPKGGQRVNSSIDTENPPEVQTTPALQAATEEKTGARGGGKRKKKTKKKNKTKKKKKSTKKTKNNKMK